MPAKSIKIPIPFIAQCVDYHDFKRIEIFIAQFKDGYNLDYAELGNPDGYHAIFYRKGTKPPKIIEEMDDLAETIPWDKPNKVLNKAMTRIHNKMLKRMEETAPMIDWTDLMPG